MNPEFDLQLRRWRDLTNVHTSPELPHRVTKCTSSTHQPFIIEDGSISDLILHHSTVEQLDKEPCAEVDIMNVLHERSECMVEFKLQYLVITERLKVTIAGVSNCFQHAIIEMDLTVNVEVCLMPGKCQTQITQVCKGTRNPVFNCVMYFKGLTLQEIHHMYLRVKVNGRDAGRRSLSKLGEVTVSLKYIDIVTETVLEESITKEIGHTSESDWSLRKKMCAADIGY